MKRIIIIAGDKSGDLYGGLLCQKLNEKYAGVQITSFGGENLARNSHQVINLLQHSVSGIFEVFFSLQDLIESFNRILQEISVLKPDLIILIDFPDFNLRLAKVLNNKFRIFYYISPQVWAWRKKRIDAIKRYVNRMIVIFRFEEEFYHKQGMDAFYFGHPLLDIIEKKPIETKKIISFMPGSRKNEIKRHLPIMIKAKELLQKELLDYSFRIIRPENIALDFYQEFNPGMPVINRSYDAIGESAFVITSSGTATVEIALLEVPFLVIYKLDLLSWQVLKGLVKMRFVAMVNILSSRKIVEELLQENATAENIAQITLRYLRNDDEYSALKQQLSKIREELGPNGAIDKLSDFIAKFLQLTKIA
jgi:lipid-A-disaccharide synthase